MIRTPSTGLSGLDQVLKGLLPGDNVVWHVEDTEDYREFVRPYIERAKQAQLKVVYFRFAKHAALLDETDGAEIMWLHPHAGFETFISEIHWTIQANGPSCCYVFDCLSDLATDWYSDQMLANFFMLTCPFILDIKAVSYFALYRNAQSEHATSPIEQTTQIFLDVFRHDGELYVCPRKVEWRYSPTMFMLHRLEGGKFHTVTQSERISEVMASAPWMRFESGSLRLNVWSRTMREAEEASEAIRAGEAGPDDFQDLLSRVLRMMVSRDERVLGLAHKYFDVPTVLEIGRRMVGTGLIGGKSVGMLLARAILAKKDPKWQELREIHDSFYIGSDVFYTFLVRNGCWWVREKQKKAETFLDGAAETRLRIQAGTFPEYILKSFSDMLDYFGQSPIIVRSSSLLEDNFGNAFSGKYESVFCPNQGPREQRLADFLSAVRRIYASSMSEAALTYRAERGILDRDEQMSLLVQRVSGSLHGGLFFPDIAGVGYSFNPYVWNRDISPDAGMLRLVFGLGTRAVERSDDDYTRVVSLSAPELRPEASFSQVRRYAQHRVDVLDLETNQFASLDFSEVVEMSPGLPLDLFALRDSELDRLSSERGGTPLFPWVLTFDGVFKDTTFVSDMERIVATLQEAYEYPVDIEFTANRGADGNFRINLLQCRPFPVKGGATRVEPPPGIHTERLLFHSRGPVIGHSRMVRVGRIIYVPPAVYGQLGRTEQYTVARLVGRLAHMKDGRRGDILLMGPGRWGTTTPSLGVPVTFAEINSVAVLCEIVAMREDLVPDVSLGTHFFNDLVERDILYVGVFPEHEESTVNVRLIEQAPNRLADLIPAAASSANVIKVLDPADLGPSCKGVTLYANAVTQRVVCCTEEE